MPPLNTHKSHSTSGQIIWVTRTEPSATESAKILKHNGFDPVIAPLLRVSPPPSMPACPEPNAVIVFTAKNGIDAFCALTDRRCWSVVTVGDATATYARLAGFTHVSSANGTSEDVTALVQNIVPITTPIFHAAGQHVRGQICEDLQRAGYTVERAVFYHSTPVSTLPDIDYKAISTVLLYSPQAARTFTQFAPTLSRARKKFTLISISAATDKALGALMSHNRLIATRPTETAMITHLQNA